MATGKGEKEGDERGPVEVGTVARAPEGTEREGGARSTSTVGSLRGGEDGDPLYLLGGLSPAEDWLSGNNCSPISF